MPLFQKLSTSNFKLIKLEIAEFFYKRNTNIALENSIEKDEYIDFRKKTESALAKQFKVFTKEETISGITASLRKAEDRDLILVVAGLLIAFSDAFSTGEKGIYTYLLWSAREGGSSALDKLRISRSDFNAVKDSSQKIILDRATYLVNQLDETTATVIAGMVKSGLAKGFSDKEISLIIEENYPSMVKSRAEVIAETELANMMGAFTVETFENNGVGRYHWVTAGDEKTCPICRGNEEQGPISVGELFKSGTAYPPAHIGCRCYLMPDQKFRGSRVWRG